MAEDRQPIRNTTGSQVHRNSTCPRIQWRGKLWPNEENSKWRQYFFCSLQGRRSDASLLWNIIFTSWSINWWLIRAEKSTCEEVTVQSWKTKGAALRYSCISHCHRETRTINSLPVCTVQAHTHSRTLIFYLMCPDEDRELTRNQPRLEVF